MDHRSGKEMKRVSIAISVAAAGNLGGAREPLSPVRKIWRMQMWRWGYRSVSCVQA